MARDATLGLLLAGLAAATPAASPPVVEITAPQRGEILYGQTLVSAAADAGTAAHLLFYLDAFAAPICRDDEPPYECRFDAGTRFAGRTIRVDALDRDGRLLGSDTLRTTDATEPVRVTSYTIAVPVVATTKDGKPAEFRPEDLECLYGSEACEVLALRKLLEPQAPERQTPTYVEILIDTSGSMRVHRKDLQTAAALLIDGLPRGTQVQIAEFAHVRRIVVPFTADKEALQSGIDDLGKAGDMSCVLSAMEGGAEWLAAQAGARVLFVISDGVDTCDPGRIHDRFYSKSLMARTFEELNVSLYLFRMAVPDSLRHSATFAIYENLARVTGGKFFDQGTYLFGGSGAATGSNLTIDWAAEQLVNEVNRTHVVEVGLPDGTEERTRRRLDLKHSDRSIRLRYQEYWDANSRKAELLRMLYAGLNVTREQAAVRLAAIGDIGTAEALLASLEVEPTLRVRAQKLIALYSCLIAGFLYGDEGRQKTAVKVAERLAEVQPEAAAWLHPVTRVYLKTPAPERLKKRVRALMSAADLSPTPAGRPE